MTATQAISKPRRGRGSGGFRPRRAGLWGGLTEQYRSLKRRLADLLSRGDRDYAMLSALSQEVGRIRQKIRADLQRRRDERASRKAAKKATPGVLIGGSGKDRGP